MHYITTYMKCFCGKDYQEEVDLVYEEISSLLKDIAIPVSVNSSIESLGRLKHAEFILAEYMPLVYATLQSAKLTGETLDDIGSARLGLTLTHFENRSYEPVDAIAQKFSLDKLS